ncbi:aldehyde dehydrogenase family protein [Rhizobium sp. VS19-DR104.2]|nr:MULTISPECIES: aldehyde dehydrogenase family protein [unclassified Rhizobium]MBZ5786290.1 aldehyde dehydrogenase family protein [Rhizobium sp. VS19-DR121]MBZ5804284.1 aldehyde dehydrogenase family protein [Rhizobium sp. VS19-DR181]MBZ5843909.1 aldehyde dehydrogenase family protein [Rhizobium sp. VS19-DR104.1]MBZ5762366.1 aldehyde dehydrogenase family protein [Rhizobium sp. VS19-DR96]MBZ5769118.1 aldehyde dehydrogenase family protein [Rhizobium sp. VS19-DR129.2]
MTAARALKQLNDEGLLRSEPFIDGQWQISRSATGVADPASDDEIARVGDCDLTMLDRAIDAAQRAFPFWRALLPRDRGRIMLNWAKLIRLHAGDLATILTAEQGKPLFEAEAEILYGVGFIEWFAAEGERAYGETIPSHKPDSRLFVSMQPVGVYASRRKWTAAWWV